MNDRSLITTGAIGAALAAICCTTPLLAVVLGGVGLTAWLAHADYAVMPAYRRWRAAGGAHFSRC
ncbi:MAG: mercury resistance system transport protein MerF [Pseudomonadota bacterium]|nr:mercury resistance system transport protein MerF [Pseudomonadota bacterium]